MSVRVIPASGWTSASSTWCGQASDWSWQLPPQLRNRNVSKKSTTLGLPPSHPQWRWTNTSDRIQHLEVLVTEFRKERDDCDHTVQRRSELARSPWTRQDWFPKRWKSCHSGSRPHLQGCRWPWSGKISPLLPSCLHSRQGGMKLASAKRRCNPGSALVVMK